MGSQKNQDDIQRIQEDLRRNKDGLNDFGPRVKEFYSRLPKGSNAIPTRDDSSSRTEQES